MKFLRRGPFFVFALVLVWRVLLLVFTVQPIPANDAFGYDGGVVNFLDGGRYSNPSMAIVFPISGKELYATYPPLYQGALFLWMKAFGTSVVSAMALHLALFAVSGFLTLWIVRILFPNAVAYAVIAALFFGITFDDRPEALAYVFGLASLLLVARQMAGTSFRPGVALGLFLCQFLCLYTSVIVGAFFFDVGFLAWAAGWMWRRRLYGIIPFIATAAAFAAVTFAIAKLEPLWWAGFMESAREQSVMTTGFHAPHGADVLKLIRTTPVFLLALAALPMVLRQRREIFAQPSVWLALTGAIFVAGWLLLALCLTLLPANYCYYVVLTQIILAAGLLALAQRHFPRREHLLQTLLWACVLLVSIRAIGMTTWGVACAWKNSYQNSQAVLRQEFQPFAKTQSPVVVSSAYLYCATALGVQNPVHSDWYFDHANWTNNAEMNALARLRPPKLVLTQFDYYRDFEPVLNQLRQHPELVDVRVRNLAVVRSPDSFPPLRRVLQHISWAPVIVDLEWKNF